jgi:hypothetical protein
MTGGEPALGSLSICPAPVHFQQNSLQCAPAQTVGMSSTGSPADPAHVVFIKPTACETWIHPAASAQTMHYPMGKCMMLRTKLVIRTQSNIVLVRKLSPKIQKQLASLHSTEPLVIRQKIAGTVANALELA